MAFVLFCSMNIDTLLEDKSFALICEKIFKFSRAIFHPQYIFKESLPLHFNIHRNIKKTN